MVYLQYWLGLITIQESINNHNNNKREKKRERERGKKREREKERERITYKLFL